jgi:murein DD-endopeptidase MepM/ murein hydrolase activator NlpD
MRVYQRKSRKAPKIVILLVVVAVAAALWTTLRIGPSPEVTLDTERPAVGRTNRVTAAFAEPRQGLGTVRLELIQGERTELLAERSFERSSGLPFLGEAGTTGTTLEAIVGTDAFPWLEEGEVVLRAVADRAAGALRGRHQVVIERTLPVRRRPPRLELVSSQHYARQGGSGAVVYRVGETVVRSGVRSGDFFSPGFLLEGGGAADRFALYALPWDLSDATRIRLFAEDDAGNRAEQPFLDIFKPMPPRTATIRVTDAFLSRVVPAIASQTPGFDDSGSLLDQYLRINGDLRRKALEGLVELARSTEPAFLWSGAFLQMPNSALEANFAQTRTYTYDGSVVDRQTHLGLDLASTSRAPVPAPNSGRVVYAGWMSLYGYAVVIDHGYGLLSLSGHLSTVNTAVGDTLTAGEIIGSSGATGLAGGDHLHLEILLHGQSVNPLEWFDAKWIRDNLGTKLAIPID